MTDKYTPTTDAVMSGFFMWRRKNDRPAFERWLNQVKAEAWDEGREVGHLDRSVWAGHAPKPKRNPYREAVTE